MKKLIFLVIMLLVPVMAFALSSDSGSDVRIAKSGPAVGAQSSSDSAVENLAKIIASGQQADRQQRKDIDKKMGVIADGVTTVINNQGNTDRSIEYARNQEEQNTKAIMLQEAAHTGATLKTVWHTSYFTWGVIALAAILIGVAIGLFGRRNRDAVNAHATTEANRYVNRLDQTDAAVADVAVTATDILAEVRAGFAATQTGINDVRNDIADLPAKIGALDPADFVFEIENHVVTYRSPAEGITAGYYLELHVAETYAGDMATYNRTAEGRRGVVHRNAKQIMGRFFRGELKGKPQEKYIEYLKSTGDLSWRTV